MLVKRETTNKDRLINKIIDVEFALFDQVKDMDGRASCQDDFKTFYIMRFSQHNLFEEGSLLSYLLDLERARAEGINLITNKYSYMMEGSDREYYERYLKPFLPPSDEEKERVIGAITSLFEEAYNRLLPLYPRLLQSGRGMSEGRGVSVLLYLSCELKIYSAETLTRIRKDMEGLIRSGINPVEKLYKTMLEFYGIGSLYELENSSDN